MQVSDEIIKVLEYLGEKFGIVFDSTKENILPYAQQLAEKYIKWEISTSVAWICIAVIFLIVGILFSICGVKKFEEDILIITVPVVLLSLIVIGYQVFDIIQCNVFPEKRIYEYVSYLLQNK